MAAEELEPLFGVLAKAEGEQEPSSHLTSDALAVHTQISQHEDCGVLFNKNTFSRVGSARSVRGSGTLSTPIGLSVAFAPRHGSAVPPPASAPTCKRKSVVTNIFLVACGVQGIVESAGGRQSCESAFPVTLPNLGALETKVWIVFRIVLSEVYYNTMQLGAMAPLVVDVSNPPRHVDDNRIAHAARASVVATILHLHDNTVRYSAAYSWPSGPYWICVCLAQAIGGCRSRCYHCWTPDLAGEGCPS